VSHKITWNDCSEREAGINMQHTESSYTEIHKEWVYFLEEKDTFRMESASSTCYPNQRGHPQQHIYIATFLKTW
jgi:hypothetical protein